MPKIPRQAPPRWQRTMGGGYRGGVTRGDTPQRHQPRGVRRTQARRGQATGTSKGVGNGVGLVSVAELARWTAQAIPGAYLLKLTRFVLLCRSLIHFINTALSFG